MEESILVKAESKRVKNDWYSPSRWPFFLHTEQYTSKKNAHTMINEAFVQDNKMEIVYMLLVKNILRTFFM